jgi:hypothetical protein
MVYLNIYMDGLTSLFLLYMPVFAALAGGKVPLYRLLYTPAGGKVAPVGGKVLYNPLEELCYSASTLFYSANKREAEMCLNFLF